MMWRVGTVVALHDETPRARTITLQVADWPSHVAGQHVNVRLRRPEDTPQFDPTRSLQLRTGKGELN